jgi:hypothetical protein
LLAVGDCSRFGAGPELQAKEPRLIEPHIQAEAGQQRDNAKTAQDKKIAEEQFGQSLGRIEPKRSEVEGSSLPKIPPVN